MPQPAKRPKPSPSRDCGYIYNVGCLKNIDSSHSRLNCNSGLEPDMFDVGQHQDAPKDIGKHRCECHRSQRQLGLDPFSNEAYREVSDVHCPPDYSLEASTRDRLSW